MGILSAAPLDVGEGVVQALGDLADLIVGDSDLLVAHGQLADGGDNGGGAGAPGLFQGAVLGGLEELLGGDAALLHLVAPVLQQLDAGTAGDAVQHGAVQVGGEDLAGHLEHDVHGTDLLNVLAVHAVQPQHLAVTVGLSPVAGPQGGSVVAAGLGHTGAALDGADVLVLHIDLHGIQALGIVGAHGADDDDVLAVVRAMYAQSGVQAHHEGADVQGGILRGRHPVLLQLYQLGNTRQGQLLGDLGQGHTGGGVVHAAHVVQGAEQLDGAVSGAVSLQALKDLLSIVEHLGGGVNGQRAIGHDAGIMPALTGIIVHDEHMVGHSLAEHQGGGVGLLLERLGASDLDLFHIH